MKEPFQGKEGGVMVTEGALSDSPVDIKFKLSALWGVYMFVFIYTDYHKLFVPGVLSDAMSGVMEGIQLTDTLLLVFSIVTILPAVMIFLCFAVPARINRWLNIVVGSLYALIGVVSLVDHAWPFWVMYCSMLTLTALFVVALAVRWPRDC